MPAITAARLLDSSLTSMTAGGGRVRRRRVCARGGGVRPGRGGGGAGAGGGSGRALDGLYWGGVGDGGGRWGDGGGARSGVLLGRCGVCEHGVRLEHEPADR